MAYYISGTADVGTRILVLEESDRSISHNIVTEDFEYSINTELTNKIVIGRNSSGEAMGYSSVVPVGSAYNILGLNGFEECGNLLDATFGFDIIESDIGTLLVSAEGGKIFRSTNGGDSWSSISLVGDTGSVTCLAKNNNGVIFAGTLNGKIHKTTNDGLSWVATSTMFGLMDVNDIIYDSYSNSIWVVGMGNPGVWRSTNSGGTWIGCTDVHLNTDNIRSICLKNGVVHIGTAYLGNCYTSYNNGVSWNLDGDLLGAVWVESMFMASSGNLFAGSYNGANIWKSTDDGTTWIKKCVCSDYDSSLERVRKFIEYQNVLYALAQFQYESTSIFYSTDDGENWYLDNTLVGGGYGIIVSNNLLYVTTGNQGNVYKSLDPPTVPR